MKSGNSPAIMVKRLPQRSIAIPPATVPSGLTPDCKLAVEKFEVMNEGISRLEGLAEVNYFFHSRVCVNETGFRRSL
jgi:hypothetical protein